jgi:hypothetical protein
MIDFKKLSQANPVAAPSTIIETFQRLDRQVSHVELSRLLKYLPFQSALLSLRGFNSCISSRKSESDHFLAKNHRFSVDFFRISTIYPVCRRNFPGVRILVRL